MLNSCLLHDEYKTVVFRQKECYAINMKKIWVFLLFSPVFFLFFSDFFQDCYILKKIGGLEIFINGVLVLYYIQSKQSKKVKFKQIDLYLIEALIFTIVGASLLFLFNDYQLLMFIHTVGFFLTHFMYINVFRDEGSVLPALSTVIKEWKIIILTVLFFVGLVFLLNTYTPNSLLLISFVYSTQMMVLCWMAYFRPVLRKAFYMGFLGIFLMVMSNLWLALNLLYQPLDYATGIYFLLYASSQFLILESISYNQKHKSTNLP